MRTTLILISAGSTIIIASLATILYMHASTAFHVGYEAPGYHTSASTTILNTQTPTISSHTAGAIRVNESAVPVLIASSSSARRTYTNEQYGFSISYHPSDIQQSDSPI